MSENDKCLFCNIESAPTSEIVYKDETYLAFKDIRPATAHHYLIIPRKHIKSTSSLSVSDIDLVKKLVEVGETVLKDASENVENARFGFHMPPFNSIQHLHLHAIAPISEMGFISRWVFRPDSYWFITPPRLIEKLKKSGKEAEETG